MKRRAVLLVLLAMLLLLPVSAGAQGMMGFDGQVKGPGMMTRVEERALGDDIHEEMEDLMEKMMAGNLTDAEESRLVTLMNEYPGPYGTMLSRMMYGSLPSGAYSGAGGWMYGMMGSGTVGLALWTLGILTFLNLVVWLVGGVFFIQWLVGQKGRI